MLRSKALLHVALNCIYLQDGDDIVLSLGQPALRYDGYESVLTDEDVYGQVVRGYRAEPKPLTLKGDHRAACVHTNWIYMFLCHGKAQEAAKLVDRAAETMCRISCKIGQAALDLATQLEDDIPLVAEHPLQPFVPRLPYHIGRQMVARDLTAFDTAVMEVFSFHVCTARDRWLDINEVQLSCTGMRKRYEDMTREERAASGTVELRQIIANLADPATVHEAVAQSLVAARALEMAARRLVAAL